MDNVQERVRDYLDNPRNESFLDSQSKCCTSKLQFFQRIKTQIYIEVPELDDAAKHGIYIFYNAVRKTKWFSRFPTYKKKPASAIEQRSLTVVTKSTTVDEVMQIATSNLDADLKKKLIAKTIA